MQALRLLFLAVGAGAVRIRQHKGEVATSVDSSEKGVLKNLYTFGAPKTAEHGLEDPLSADGCFSGLRIVNKVRKLIHQVDIVPALLVLTRWRHTKVDAAFLYQDESAENRTCGWSGNTVEWVFNFDLHKLDMYVERTARDLPELANMVNVALKISYIDNVGEAAAFIRERGFGLVGSGLCTEFQEVSHLIQDPNTLDCWLTFEGSDNLMDWMYNLLAVKAPFCGLSQRVHKGFAQATNAMVMHPSFQANVRPKLGHCRSVEVLGHSLGGSLATLFNACAHNHVEPGAPGYDEYKYYGFKKLETKRMEYL